MTLPDFSSIPWFILLTAIFFLIIVGRYFLIAGLFYLLFYRWFFKYWEKRKINHKDFKAGQFRREIKWSIITSFLFALSGTITTVMWQHGYSRIYTKLNLYGWWYLPVSLLVFMALHDSYYYWLHRWMHFPRIFRTVHKLHHDSKIASPFTAFSFHPIEGIIQAVFMPVLLMILPMHYYVIILQLTIMTFSSVINHLDIELYPSVMLKPNGGWIIGATHHAMHHKQFKCNFGLYFTFWDKWRKTESPGLSNPLYNKPN